MSPLSVFKETGGFKIGSTQNKRMVDRVALLVQARQDRQNKCQTSRNCWRTTVYSGRLSLYFEWSPPVILKNDAHPTPRNLPIVTPIQANVSFQPQSLRSCLHDPD